MTWYRWFDEKRHVSVMDVEAPSAFRLVQGVLPSDNELVASNVYYCTVISHSIAREILLRARQPSARNTLEAAMDTVCRLCEDTNTGHLSMLGQSVMVHLLESCYGYAEERDSLQVSKEQLFTYPLLRDEWNKAFATMDVESADRVLCASLLQNEKVAAIRKSRRSKYVQLVFIKNDEYVANRMFHLDNLRRDFRKSKDLTFVYCPIVEADSDRLVFEKYQKMYPEEDYVMFSMEDYVQMLNAIASPYKTLDVTMDKSGHVLLVPLNPEDEFHFRYLLRRMLEKDKERK